MIALRELGQTDAVEKILDLLDREEDRIVYYAAWGALMDLVSVEERRKLLSEERSNVRLAAFLSLLEEDALSDKVIEPFTKDKYPAIAGLAAKRLGGKHKFEHRGRPLSATGNMAEAKPLVVPFTDVVASTGRSYRPAVLEPGTPFYTDRGYRISKVSPELSGLTFLQTACSDADAESGITVTLNLRYPSTVYFIDDARAEALPAWARGKWTPTELVIEGDDPKAMKVYKAELPAGPMTLGTSRDGIKARKGNYLVAF